MSSETIKEEAVDINEVMALAARLSPVDKVKLIERLLTHIKIDLRGVGSTSTFSSAGIAADLGVAPSAEEIDEARREMYGCIDKDV